MNADAIIDVVRRPRPGKVFIFAGPSGAGKSTVCAAVRERVAGAAFSVSHTTRPPRPGESDGREYFFVTDEEFTRIAAAGGFAEYAEVHGHRYGTARRFLEDNLKQGVDTLLDIDVQGAAQIRRGYAAAVGIFVLPPSLDTLRSRLVQRGQNDAGDLERRLAVAAREIEEAAAFDYILVNDDLVETAEAAAAIIRAERVKNPIPKGGRR